MIIYAIFCALFYSRVLPPLTSNTKNRHIWRDQSRDSERREASGLFLLQSGSPVRLQGFFRAPDTPPCAERTKITRQILHPATAAMHVKYSNEQGKMDIAAANGNAKVTCTVERERKGVSKDVAGAGADAGPGSLNGNILRPYQSAGDSVAGAIGGVATAGAHMVQIPDGKTPKTGGTGLPRSLQRLSRTPGTSSGISGRDRNRPGLKPACGAKKRLRKRMQRLTGPVHCSKSFTCRSLPYRKRSTWERARGAT